MSDQRSLIDVASVHGYAKIIEEKIGNIDLFWSKVQACAADFMCTRDIIKCIFDSLENEDNEIYIGVLEWSFTQEIIENCLIGSFSIDTDRVLGRFFSNRDVKMMMQE